MKAKKRKGAIIILSASLICYACALIFNFNFLLAVIMTTILNAIGLCLISLGIESEIELVPSIRYKLVHYLEESLEGGTITYATLEYQDIYGTKRIHTFKNVNFENYDPGSFSPIYEPKEGSVYAAYMYKSGEIFLRKE